MFIGSRIKKLLLIQIYILCVLLIQQIYVVSKYNKNYAAINNGVIKLHNFRRYQPTWDDLDKRPLPEWYDRAKVGIFLHWGVYSVPSYGSEWFWAHCNDNNSSYVNFMKANYPPGFTYQAFAPMFTAEFFDPDKWAELFVKSGAKYIVLTSKHHEGYTLFPSHRSFSWNSVEVGPRRDLVGDLARAVRAKDLKFGVYYSLLDWFNPLYLKEKWACQFPFLNFFFKVFIRLKKYITTTWKAPQRDITTFDTRKYPDTIMWPDLKQLVNDYKPSVIWSDGDWEALDTYWNSTDFLAWLYNDSPVKDDVVVNDRWGIGSHCKHGDFYNCVDRYNLGILQKYKWENAFTIDSKSWGYRREMEFDQILTTEQLLYQTVSTVSCGGNVLINVGPTKEGTITPIFQERLLSLGKWLSINGEAIYETSPWYYQQDSLNKDAWYTCTKQQYNGQQPTAPPSDSDEVIAIYATLLSWPQENKVVLKDITKYINTEDYKVVLLGHADIYLNMKIESGYTYISLLNKALVKSEHAWSLKFTPSSHRI